jgi:hypothetical protein
LSIPWASIIRAINSQTQEIENALSDIVGTDYRCAHQYQEELSEIGEDISS